MVVRNSTAGHTGSSSQGENKPQMLDGALGQNSSKGMEAALSGCGISSSLKGEVSRIKETEAPGWMECIKWRTSGGQKKKSI